MSGPRTRNTLVVGVGVNDADYNVANVDNRTGKPSLCPYYDRWRGMLRRCYSPIELEKYPTYLGCEVVEEWKRFSVFRDWMKTQNWENMQLDKDFLGNGKIYSPNSCIFIPGWLNALFVGRKAEKYLGVHARKYGYVACIQKKDKKRTYLGYFTCPIEACSVYIEAKTKYVRSLYPEISQIDVRLVAGCERKLLDMLDHLERIK